MVDADTDTDSDIDTDCIPKQWRYELLRTVSWQRVQAL